MLALIKIRCKYLSNHRYSAYWSYFFLPSITLIYLIIILKIAKFDKRNIIRYYYRVEKFYGKDLNITKPLFSNNIEFSKYNFS